MDLAPNLKKWNPVLLLEKKMLKRMQDPFHGINPSLETDHDPSLVLATSLKRDPSLERDPSLQREMDPIRDLFLLRNLRDLLIPKERSRDLLLLAGSYLLSKNSVTPVVQELVLDFFFFFWGTLFSRKFYLKNFNIKNKDNKISQGKLIALDCMLILMDK